MLILETTLPVKTVSEANMREHWAAKHKRKKAQQEIVGWTLLKEFGKSPYKKGQRVLLEITRVATRKLDRDNLYGSGKHVVDAICKWLDIDDGDKLFTLSYSQEFKSKTNEVKLKLTIQD